MVQVDSLLSFEGSPDHAPEVCLTSTFSHCFSKSSTFVRLHLKKERHQPRENQRARNLVQQGGHIGHGHRFQMSRLRRWPHWVDHHDGTSSQGAIHPTMKHKQVLTAIQTPHQSLMLIAARQCLTKVWASLRRHVLSNDTIRLGPISHVMSNDPCRCVMQQ